MMTFLSMEKVSFSGDHILEIPITKKERRAIDLTVDNISVNLTKFFRLRLFAGINVSFCLRGDTEFSIHLRKPQDKPEESFAVLSSSHPRFDGLL